MKKQPKPKPHECWCALYEGKIRPGWCNEDRATVRAWVRDTGGPMIRVRIVPVAPKKRAKAKRGGK